MRFMSCKVEIILKLNLNHWKVDKITYIIDTRNVEFH